VKNKMLPKPDLEPGGLGLSNLRSRLEKIYPGKYRLELQKKNDFFVACLSINFQPELKGKK
ncbi:MAG: hypothetical protein KDC53_09840, partial [Saprospiraceae bacterium]|nr:hypothetical protein [Saprospiraceae bacterium]